MDTTRIINIRTVRSQAESDLVYVGRPSKWGNPFKIGEDGTREEVVERYRTWIQEQPELMADLHTFKGRTLGCYCAPLPCHADVLAELADAAPDLVEVF